MTRLVDDGPEVGGERLPLELCTGETPECPHYACPDGWHPGEAPNCSCTPDCALEDEDDDGLVLIAGVLYDRETLEEARA